MNPFYRYYDVLFESKNYAEEVNAVLELCKTHKGENIKQVLDVGCGTGNHSIEFVKRGSHVTAFDTDKRILGIAKGKIGKANLSHIEVVERWPQAKYNLIVALFHVVTYIEGTERLEDFFQSACRCLDRKGLFIFDCWNGDVVVKDPPGTKETQVSHQDKTIKCHLTSQTDIEKQKTVLNYHIEVCDSQGKQVECADHSFVQMLWKRKQLESAVKKSGLKVLDIVKPYSLKKAGDDWKVMYVCGL